MALTAEIIKNIQLLAEYSRIASIKSHKDIDALADGSPIAFNIAILHSVIIMAAEKYARRAYNNATKIEEMAIRDISTPIYYAKVLWNLAARHADKIRRLQLSRDHFYGVWSEYCIKNNDVATLASDIDVAINHDDITITIDIIPSFYASDLISMHIKVNTIIPAIDSSDDASIPDKIIIHCDDSELNRNIFILNRTN